MGYYSGMREWIDRIFVNRGIDIGMTRLILLMISAVILLAIEIWTDRKKERRGFLWQMILFAIIGTVITALQNSSELDGGVRFYFPTILSSIAMKHFIPVVKFCSSLIIYTITFLTMAQFIQWRVREWKRNSQLLERSRFARENYELAMQAEEDSRIPLDKFRRICLGTCLFRKSSKAYASCASLIGFTRYRIGETSYPATA